MTSQVSSVSEDNCFSEKKYRFLINSGHKTAVAIVSDFGRGGLFLQLGGCGHGVMMMTMEAVGNAEAGQVEGF